VQKQLEAYDKAKLGRLPANAYHSEKALSKISQGKKVTRYAVRVSNRVNCMFLPQPWGSLKEKRKPLLEAGPHTVRGEFRRDDS